MGACGSKDDDVPERSSRSGVSRSTLNLGSSDVSTLGSLPSKDATGSEDNGPVVGEFTLRFIRIFASLQVS